MRPSTSAFWRLCRDLQVEGSLGRTILCSQDFVFMGRSLELHIPPPALGAPTSSLLLWGTFASGISLPPSEQGLKSTLVCDLDSSAFRRITRDLQVEVET